MAEDRNLIICKDQALRREIEPYIAKGSQGRKAVLTGEYGTGREFLKKCPKRCYSFFFYYGHKVWSMEEEGEILQLQKELLEKRDYGTAKIYNEYLIMVTRLNQHKTWLFYPREIQLEHTDRCNARCIMCGHCHADKSKCRDMPADTFQRIQPFLPFCRHVGLHGYGEPFLAEHILDYMEAYRKYQVRLYANSNLSYVPDQLLPYIDELFDEINVSCESVRKKDYERIRRGLHFERFVENVEKVREKCPHVRLNLFAVIMRQNLEQLAELVEFAAEHGFAKVSMTEMIAMEENGNFGDVPGLYPNVLSQALKKACQRAKELKVELHFPKEAVKEKEEEEDLKQEQRRLYAQRGTDLISHGDGTSLISHGQKHAQPGLEGGEEGFAGGGTGLIFHRQKITKEAETDSIHSCEGICDVFSSQLYCTLDGKLAVCCVDGYHYTEKLEKIQSIKEYWKAPSVQAIRECFQKKKLPSICNNCNFIILDQLKYLDVLDRKTYLETVNQKEEQCE